MKVLLHSVGDVYPDGIADIEEEEEGQIHEHHDQPVHVGQRMRRDEQKSEIHVEQMETDVIERVENREDRQSQEDHFQQFGNTYRNALQLAVFSQRKRAFGAVRRSIRRCVFRISAYGRAVSAGAGFLFLRPPYCVTDEVNGKE